MQDEKEQAKPQATEGRQVVETTPTRMMETALKLYIDKKLSKQDAGNLFEAFMIEDLDERMSFRTIKKVVLIFWKNKLIDQDQLAAMTAKVIDVLQKARAEHFPEMDKQDPVEPNAENPQEIIIVEAGTDRTLRELAGLFKPGQEARFAQENFQPWVLEKFYDGFARPDQSGEMKGLAKFAIKIFAKIADPNRLVEAFSGATNFTWRDDGLTQLDPQFHFYNTQKELDQAIQQRGEGAQRKTTFKA